MYNLISLNVNSLNDHIKCSTLIDWLKCMKADIVCLQETHASCHSTIQSWFRNSGFRVVSSSTSNKRCGTAILVRDIYQITHICKDDDGRFSQVEVDFEGEKVRFVSLYVPNKNPARNTFLASFPDYVDLAAPTFICVDFNAVLNPDLDRRHHPSYTGPSRCFARSHAAERSKHKLDLERQLKRLQCLFDHGDSFAFSQLCAIQEELRAIHLHAAKASQVCARCMWAEEGETSSSFFLSLEKKHRSKQSIMSIRDPESGLVHHDPFEILGTWRRYYTALFSADICDHDYP